MDTIISVSASLFKVPPRDAYELTSTTLEYFVNGANVYSDTTIGATQFSAVIMQAYNFADPALGSPATVPYVAHWSNGSNVPEPGSLALAGLALAGLAALRARKTT